MPVSMPASRYLPLLVLLFCTVADPLLLSSARGTAPRLLRATVTTSTLRRIVPQSSAADVEGTQAVLELPRALEGLVPTRFDDVPKMVDTVLAGLGLSLTIIALGFLQSLLGIKLFVPPMMASGIIFFGGSKPPNPKGFLSGTICSATVSVGLLATIGRWVPEVTAQGLSVGLLLMWYKTAGTLFPPAAVLAGGLFSAAAGSAASADGAVAAASAAASFLVFPWLSGHAVLYLSALGLSGVRSRARLEVTAMELRSLSGLSDDLLRDVFDKFDTNNSGSLDADELKVALRIALGDDLSTEDCRRLVRSADRDGNDVVDFDEFCFICRGAVF